MRLDRMQLVCPSCKLRSTTRIHAPDCQALRNQRHNPNATPEERAELVAIARAVETGWAEKSARLAARASMAAA